MEPDNNQGFKLLACFLGFSLFWGWRWMYYYSDLLMVVGDHNLPTASLIKNLDFLFQFLVLIVFIAAIMRDIKPLISDKTLVFMAAGLGLISSPLITLSGYLGESAWMLLSALGWIFRGLAGSALTCLWAKIFCSVSERNACLYIALSLALSTVIALVISAFPLYIALAITTLLPVASTAIFYIARENLEYRPQKYDRMLQRRKDASLFPTPMMHILAAVTIVSIVFGSLVIFMAVNQSGTTLLTGRVSMLAPGVAGALIALVIYLSPKMSSIGRLYSFSLPLFAVGALVYLLAGHAYHSVSSFVMVVGFMLFDTIIWVVLIDGAMRRDYPILGAFLLGRAANTLGMFIGRLVTCLYLDHFLANQALALPLVAAIVAFLFFTSTQLLHENVMFANERLSDEIPKTDMDLDDAIWPSRLFEQALDAVSKNYGLSPREAEVLALLAKGKTSKQIQESLVVSSHTVNAHTYHIYQKCGVHKKAEVQELVESFMQ